MYLLKKWSWVAIFVLILNNFSGCAKHDEKPDIIKFFEARKSGDVASAYEMLSDSSKKAFSKEQFENYCFVFRVIDYKVESSEYGFVVVSYNFYDKKLSKETKELYTYYITRNLETLKVENGRIIFPHVGFVLIRQFIEQKKIEEVQKMFEKMLSIDNKNPDVIKSASLMGFQPENKK